MPDLITPAQALALLPGLAPAERLAVPGLCGPASRAVERHCKRPLAWAAHVEFHRPGDTRKLRLKAPPVAPGTLELRADLAAVAEVRCVDPAATRATVALSAAALTLARSSPAAPAPVALALASSPTLAALAAAVNASAGWECSVAPGFSGWLAADLEPSPGLASALGVAAALSAYTRGLSLWAMDDPGLGVVELTEDLPQAFRFADRTWSGPGCGPAASSRPGGDPRRADVRCSYSGGYDPPGTSGPPVPDDLMLAVALTIRSSVDALQFSGMLTSINLGNTTVAVGDQVAVPGAARLLLAPYRLRRF